MTAVSCATLRTVKFLIEVPVFLSCFHMLRTLVVLDRPILLREPMLHIGHNVRAI
jgi:hypothetical protein